MIAKAPSDPELADRILTDLVHEFDRPIVGNLVVQIFAGVVLVAALWKTVPATYALLWFILLLATKVLRLALSRRYRGDRDRDLRSAKWARDFTLARFLSACVWGLAVFVFDSPTSSENEIVTTTMLVLLAAGGITATPPLLLGHFVWVVPTIVPIVVRDLMVGDLPHDAIAAMLLMFLFFIAASARGVHALLLQSLKMRYENLSLIDQLTQQKAAAEGANRAKSRFLAAASHDLRQPLHAIGLNVEVLRRMIGTGGGADVVARIRTSVDALSALLSELLDISKLDAGIVSVQKTTFRVQDVFDRVHADFSGPALARGLLLRIRRTDAVAETDSTLLERIVRNLTSNAVRYTQRGAIFIACRPRGTRLRIEVRDSGIGIAPAEQARIFEEFYQVDNPERDRAKGLGLGLAIVQRLARLLETRIGITSAPGRGSVFSIEVPRSRQSAPPVAAVPVREPTDILRGKRVAVIDDEFEVRRSMASLFEMWGCELMAAASTDELLDGLRKSPEALPDLVVADYRLRAGETGTRAIVAVQEACGRDIPGVLITGDTAPDRLREAEASGFMLLHKPVSAAKLKSALEDALERGTEARRRSLLTEQRG